MSATYKCDSKNCSVESNTLYGPTEMRQLYMHETGTLHLCNDHYHIILKKIRSFLADWVNIPNEPY